MNKAEFDKADIEGFKRTKGKKKFVSRKLFKVEKDGTKTTAYTLEIYGKNQLHNWEGPALVNKKKRIKEYYLNGIQYTEDQWNDICKSREGLPWYKQSAPKGASYRN